MSLNPRMVRHVRSGLASRMLILLALLSGWALDPSPMPRAHAATGDFVGSVTFSQNCTSGIGTGVSFDGTNLWYTCFGSATDLLRASPTTGIVAASYSIASGLGSIAYDATRNALWAGWGDNSGAVRLITLDAGKNVTGTTVKFLAPQAVTGCGIDDGIAYDAQDDTLYISADCSQTIYHYKTDGTFLDQRPWAGNGCYNSGLAIGGQLLFQGSDGCSKVWVTDKTTNALQFTFSTVVASDPNFRDEGLSCDPVTFAPKQVMWSKGAYSPMRAHAYEVPAGTCGVGGKPTDTTPPSCVLKGTIPGGIQIAVQDSDGGLAATAGGTFTTAPSPSGGIQLTSVGNASVTIPSNGAGSTTEVDVNALKVTAGVSSHVSLQVKDVAGNVTLCDPVITAIARDEAHPTAVRADGIAQSEHLLHIYNGDPGLNHLTVLVNHTRILERDLAPNEQRTVDIASALQSGTSNTVVIIARGKQRGEAAIVIADS